MGSEMCIRDSIRTAQEREATAMRMQTVSEEAAKVASQARLSIAEGGLAGQGTNLLLQGYEAQAGAFKASLIAEQNLREAQSFRHVEDIMVGAHQQMVGTQAPVDYPSALGSALQFGAHALKTAYQSDLLKKKPEDKPSSDKGFQFQWIGSPVKVDNIV